MGLRKQPERPQKPLPNLVVISKNRYTFFEGRKILKVRDIKVRFEANNFSAEQLERYRQNHAVLIEELGLNDPQS